MGIRIDGGFPRGGLGYAGLAITLGSLLAAMVATPGIAVLTTVLAAPFSIWCGIGLRRDSDSDEAHDLIIWTDTPDMDENLFAWLLGNERTRIFRLSTVMFLGCLAAIVIALVRLLVFR
jgi:hypothetical protein